jgi:uncharacterized membrane protein YczE
MLALAARAHVRIGTARAVLETTVATIGLALGASAGPGTIIVALTIGPTIELAMALLANSPTIRKAQALAAADHTRP